MPGEVLTAAFQVKSDGSALEEATASAIDAVYVDQSLHMPDMATIELRITNFDLLDSEQLASVGKEIEVLARSNTEVDSSGALKTLFKGPIIAIEADYSATEGPRLTLRAYDKTFGLHTGTEYRTFIQQKDSDIVSQIAGQMGLQTQVDATTDVYKHVTQANVSNWEFILERARINGYVAVGREGKLKFVKPATLAGSPVTVTYAEDLWDLQITMTMAGQVNESKATSWDQSKKTVHVGVTKLSEWKTSTIKLPAANKFNGNVGWGARKVTAPVSGLASAGGAGVSAKATFDVAGSQQVHAHGIAQGNPGLQAGGRIKLEGLGSRFSGEYTLSRVRHIYTMTEGFNTEFWIGGMGSNTLAGVLLPPPAQAQRPTPAALGLVPAIVTNASDPDKLGRVKVKYPWLADDVESNWARVIMPGAGPNRGLMVLPELSDEVIVGFLHGDFNSPYVLGGVWNSKDSSPTSQSVAVAGGKVEVRQFKTRTGHMLTFTDKSGGEQIELKDSKGNFILLDTQNKLIHMKSLGDIKLEAVGTVKIESKSVDVKAQMDVKIKATTDLKMDALTVTAAGTAKVGLKAPLVDVAGTGPVTIKGTPVGIN